MAKIVGLELWISTYAGSARLYVHDPYSIDSTSLILVSGLADLGIPESKESTPRSSFDGPAHYMKV